MHYSILSAYQNNLKHPRHLKKRWIINKISVIIFASLQIFSISYASEYNQGDKIDINKLREICRSGDTQYLDSFFKQNHNGFQAWAYHPINPITPDAMNRYPVQQVTWEIINFSDNNEQRRNSIEVLRWFLDHVDYNQRPEGRSMRPILAEAIHHHENELIIIILGHMQILNDSAMEVLSHLFNTPNISSPARFQRYINSIDEIINNVRATEEQQSTLREYQRQLTAQRQNAALQQEVLQREEQRAIEQEESRRRARRNLPDQRPEYYISEITIVLSIVVNFACYTTDSSCGID